MDDVINRQNRNSLLFINVLSWYQDGSLEGTERRKTLAQVVGWYWHFMGGLWLILLFLLSFWK